MGMASKGCKSRLISLPCRENRPGAVRAAQVSAAFLPHNEQDGTEGRLPSGRERSPRGEAVVSALHHERRDSAKFEKGG